MLPRPYRLRLDKDFRRVFRAGRKIYSQNMGLRFARNQALATRFAFLVSNKVSKKAVKRNLIKRRLRVIAAGLLKEIKQPHDIIILTVPSVLGLSFKELEKEVGDLFKRAGLK